ncbi:MAG TPA: lytic murein transglycosylase [Azonexus sp.]|jgi:lytic murein transglycosylase|nr:lytic murein transglycosylase [Azonexus sp.]
MDSLPQATGIVAVAALLGLAGGPSLAQTQSQSEFANCLTRLQPVAQRSGVRPDSYSRFTEGVQADFAILDKLNYQPEFKLPIWDYLSGLVDDERIADGKAGLARHADVLQRIQATYGVDPATVVAVWGVESNYGRITGKYPLVQSLGTLSCFGRRQSYFQGEFYAALRILQRGDIAPDRLNGSWAGAFGHTQFMPATYERLAVDFDGDGRRDLVDNSDDALASTANFLRKGGWQSGLPWGVEVRLPNGFDSGLAGRTHKRALADWAASGLTLVDGRPLTTSVLPASERVGLLMLAGPRGPAFLTTRNFDVIYGYNAAESYGLAIAHLSDRLRGGLPFATPWPTDDPGLSRAERRELQTLLAARGHEIGEIDGMLGDKSRVAVRLEQSRLGQPVNGRGGQKVLQALRAEGEAQRPAGR